MNQIFFFRLIEVSTKKGRKTALMRVALCVLLLLRNICNFSVICTVLNSKKMAIQTITDI